MITQAYARRRRVAGAGIGGRKRVQRQSRTARDRGSAYICWVHIIVYTGEAADAGPRHITNLYANYIHAMGSRTITLPVPGREFTAATRV